MSSYGISHSFLAGAATSVIGFALSLKATDLATDYFPKLKERVDKLDEKARKFFYCIISSTVHSFAQVFGTVGFLRRLYGQPVINFDNRLIVEYGLTKFGPCFYNGMFVGYLLADAAHLGFKNLGPMYTVHHFMAATTWMAFEYTKSMQFSSSFLQFNEFSTIFLNLRQLYLTLGYTSKDKEVARVSYVFFFSFFLVRVLPLPILFHNWFMRDFQIIRNDVGMGVAGLYSMAYLCHAGLQSTWFIMMVRKILGTKSKKKKE